MTELSGAGGVRRGSLDTAGRGRGDPFRQLVEQAALDVPPPYRPVAGRPVYQIRAGDKVILVAEDQLAGPLRELVMTLLAAGGETPGPQG